MNEIAFDADGAVKVAWQATNEDEPGNISADNTANSTISVHKAVDLASGNIDTIDYKYGTNLLYGIRS